MKRIIAVTGYGTKVASTGNRFVIKNKENKNEISADEVSEIILQGKALNITTSAIMLAIKNRIPIFLITSFGKPYAIINPLIVSGTVLTRREQYMALNDGRGLTLAREFVHGKIKNQERLLRLRANYITKNSKDKSVEVREIANMLASIANEVYNKDNTQELLELEAKASKDYWKGFGLLLPEELGFKAREHRGARDPVNSLLNYAYGFLLTRVLDAIILAGLDPYAGFLHSDRPGRPSLALDLIEEFRQPVVDYTILKILRLKELKLDKIVEDGKLTKEAITILIKALKERLEDNIDTHDISYHIVEQARNVARFLRREINVYRPFMI